MGRKFNELINLFNQSRNKENNRAYEIGFRIILYSETFLIRRSMGPENNVGLGGCWLMDCTTYNGWIRENVGLWRCWIREVPL